MQNPIKSFKLYLKESEELTLDSPLKGYTHEQVISRIEELMGIFSDTLRFGVPADLYGRATTYRDANGAIEKIKDIQHYYESKGEEVRFYCWSISYKGSWEATNSLKEKIKETGGFGQEDNMNLKKIIEYFSSNKADTDNIRSFALSLDSKEKRELLKKAEDSTEEPQSEF